MRSRSTTGLVGLLLLASCEPASTAGPSALLPLPDPTPAAAAAAPLLAATPDPASRPRSSTVRPAECPEIAPSEGKVAQELVGLLAQARYADLEARLEAYDRAAAANLACEYHVWTVYGGLAEKGRHLHAQIDRWVEQRPSARAPLVVRAALHYDLGFASRGQKWARDTTEEQFAGMRRHFELAVRDAVASRERGPVHMVAAGTVLHIARTHGEPESALPWVKAVVEADPLNFGIRRRLVDAYQPRWGGSLETMEKLAQEAQVFADRNPRMRMLLGMPHAYRGLEAGSARQTQKAITHYSKALEYGDRGAEWSLERAKHYLALHQLEHARADIAYAKLWKPEEGLVWGLSAKIFIAEQRWEEAIAELDRALAIEPGNASRQTQRGWAHENLGHWQAAEADYRAALKVGNDAWRAAHLGKVLFRGLRRTEEAIPWLQLASQLNADDADNWFELAQAQEAMSDTGASDSYRRFLNQAANPGTRAAEARRYLARSL